MIPNEEEIFEAIFDRIHESWKRFEEGNANEAYVHAWKIGMVEDIKEALTKGKKSEGGN